MINVVDLFAGPGGLSLGLEMVRDSRVRKIFNTICAIEKDPWACATLRKNFNPEIVIEGDITTEEVKRRINEKCKGRTDIVVGGPPCQSFSLIGPRSGNPDNHKEKNRYDGHYKHFMEIVEMIRPNVFLFENVRGILSKKNGDGKIIDFIIREAENLGYSLENKKISNKYIILNAADYGVPQTRERVFIIGNKFHQPNPYPEPSHFSPTSVSLRKWNREMLEYVNIRTAIGDLPKVRPKITKTGIKESEYTEIDEYNKKIHSGKDNVAYNPKWKKNHLKKCTESGKQFFNIIRPKDDVPLTHHTARPQMKSDILLFQGMKPGTSAKDIFESKDPKIKKLSHLIKYDMNSFQDKYKKHRWDRPSSTIFAHLQKDGNRFIHPDSRQGRTFTPREAARLQSFPDSFFFEGPSTKIFQQIGNAVPPILAMKLGKSISSEIFSIH